MHGTVSNVNWDIFGLFAYQEVWLRQEQSDGR